MPSHDPEVWMWAEACQVIERAERLHRQFFQLRRGDVRHPIWEPPVDVCETAEEFRISVALPGVSPDQVEVALDRDTLIVTAMRSLPEPSQTAVIHRLEIPHGRFERRIRLPPVRLEFGQHQLIDGCLVLSLRKLG